MIIHNWFMVILAIIQIGATIYYWLDGKPIFAGIQLCYALANALFAIMKGE